MERYVIDASHTTIGFSARHLAVSTVRGQFTKFEGAFETPDGEPTSLTGKAVVEIGSVHTGNAQRDAHLTSPDFFDAATWPTLTFELKGVEHVEGDSYRALGDLTIRDVTRPVTLEATIEGRGPDPFGNKERVGLSARGQVNRLDFNLNWDGLAGAIPMASHTIKLEIDAALVAPAAELETANAAS